jgi:hypothetical protein
LNFNTEAEADAAIKVLSKTNGVVFAEKHSQPTVDNDVHYINGDQWYLNNNGANGGVVGADINAEGAWAIYTGNTNNTIAIIDDGVEITHEDLSGKASGDTPVGYSHGTSVAGVAAARANNTLGIRGVDWNAQILSKRVRDSNDNWLGDNVAAQKIVDAVNEGADVLNCSWSSTVNSSTLAVAFAYAYRANRVTVATMGNTGVQETRYPGAFPNVMAVGATQNNDLHSPYSTTGTHIDVVAPGGINPAGSTNEEDIISTTLNDDYEYVSGTSFAAPQVAGLASLLEGYNSNLDNNDIRQIIRLSADDRGNPGFDNEYGFGRVNAERALNLISAPNTLNQWAASGGTVFSSTDTYTALFIGAPGLSTANYLVKRYEVRKTITFPSRFLCDVGAWGRGVSTTGWNLSSPNFGEGFCEVIPGTQTNTGVTLRTYVYEIWSIGGSYLGYYPKSPSNVSFAYSVLGIQSPIISGPPIVCSSGATYSINNLPAEDTIIWNTSSNIALASPQGSNPCTFTANNSNNEGIIGAQIIVCGDTITLPDMQVRTGINNNDFSFEVWDLEGRLITTEYGLDILCSNTTYNLYVINNGECETTSYTWQIPSWWTQLDANENWIRFNTNSDPSGAVWVNAINCCGDESFLITGDFARAYYCYNLSFTPNPAIDETTLEVLDDSGIQADLAWDVEIYDQLQILKLKTDKAKKSNFKINTSSWKDGVYIVRVNLGKEIISGKLVVQH